FEFGSVSLLRPSLNLVRDAQGNWNVERWLPPAPQNHARPGFVGPRAASAGPREAQLYQIDVDGGRINFKQANDKSPFALLDVAGSVERNDAGHWQLDLEARPMRAGVELQDIGTLRLRGTIAGTSARLQPADLNLTWRAASLADALRLASEQDYGVRGELALDLNAHVAPPRPVSPASGGPGGAQWSITGTARLTGIHAWNLTEHSTDPAVNLSLDADWRLGQAQAEIRKLLVEMPGSHLQVEGGVEWGHGFRPQLHIASSALALEDALSWYRAFLPGVPEDLRAQGVLGVDVALGGWPIQLQQGAIASAGGTLAAKSLPAPLQIGPVNASVSSSGLDFAPTEISFSPAMPVIAEKKNSAAAKGHGEFVIRGSVSPDADGIFRWPLNWNCSIEGETSHAEDWVQLSALLAQPLQSGWTASGGVAVKARGARRSDDPVPMWTGTLDFRGLSVKPAYMNRPVLLQAAHVDFSPARQAITVTAAEALGASWKGTLSRKFSAPIPTVS
ncbi:MAG: hypothetical protein ACRD4Y_08500, partial [Candidatus Acidiferrales bacterium]